MVLTVMLSATGIRRSTNPYLTQLVSSLPADEIRVRFFSYRAAILGRYGVVHLHWPENLLRGKTPLRSAARQLLFLTWLVRLAATRTPVVQTLHNEGPHEGGGQFERWLLARLLHRTVLVIRLNAHTSVPPGQTAVDIPHGHYRDWFAAYPRSDADPRGIAFVGLIREYKGVDLLLESFRELPGDYRLTVTGQPRTPALAEGIRQIAANDKRVTLELEYVSDSTLVARVSGAQLVVLPYRNLHNSGGALAALSLDRAILVPRNAVTEALAAEVGPGWVHTFEGDVSPADLARAVAAAAATDRSAHPDLSRREWSAAGEQHAEAYRLARQSPRVRKRRL